MKITFSHIIQALEQDYHLTCNACFEQPEPAVGLSGGWFVTEWRFDLGNNAPWHSRAEFAEVFGPSRLEDADQAAMDDATSTRDAWVIEKSGRA